MIAWRDSRVRAPQKTTARKTVTVILPSGYSDAKDFATDCGLELADRRDETWTITVRRRWGERIYFAFSLLINWPKR